MATKAAAFTRWLGQFAPAFAVGNVPEGQKAPYMTFEWAEGCFTDGTVSLLVNLWCKTESEAEPNAIVTRIGEALGMGCVPVPCDGGCILLKRGSPFAQAVTDGVGSDSFKRRYINIDAEFITCV